MTADIDDIFLNLEITNWQIIVRNKIVLDTIRITVHYKIILGKEKMQRRLYKDSRGLKCIGL